MNIKFETEVKEIISDLKFAEDYLDCERAIIYHMKKHLANGVTMNEIESHLEKLLKYLENQILTSKAPSDCTNYRYAAGFVHSLLVTPYWHSWINMP